MYVDCSGVAHKNLPGFEDIPLEIVRMLSWGRCGTSDVRDNLGVGQQFDAEWLIQCCAGKNFQRARLERLVSADEGKREFATYDSAISRNDVEQDEGLGQEWINHGGDCPLQCCGGVCVVYGATATPG